MNIDFAFRLARELRARGIEELCLCAGARNSPLVAVLGALPEFRGYRFFEERSAAFFALGRIKATGRPVAVLTTSGTAAAELLPATIEAHYSGLPLLLVTADRPSRYRGTGAPQAIEQVGLFGPYVELARDVEAAARTTLSLADWSLERPAHLNLCFDEPLLDRAFSAAELGPVPVAAPGIVKFDAGHLARARAEVSTFLAGARRPWLIVGSLEEAAREPVQRFVSALGAPVYLEAQSGLREAPALAPLRVRSPASVQQEADAVLRIGGVPTLRFWRDLDEKRTELPLLSVSALPFSGSPRSRLVQAPLGALFAGLEPAMRPETAYVAHVAEREQRYLAGLTELLEQLPTSEPGMVRAFSRLPAPAARVYVGNSLPIREWDLVAEEVERGRVFGASRGANGIDGQVSTFLGFARPERENWALLGDLTAMYDLAGPWILPQLPGLAVRIGVINNGGGKIFSRIFRDRAFQNEHGTELEPWARLWGLGYQRWTEVPARFGESGSWLLELRPDPDATAAFWEAHDRLGNAR
ncbi:MAG: 2-succinyl-5-enolpyruvyl-6-hydroxy-3-cyclohexene-1-carboxylic-acid synthase [Oligoflexia bacterium]|nr:2-succinyl-5-enolpyruvyl-6-hydroxy-3-cyclohexene-1-carboxylic-acid synthase [Oligoflexia bacterium]